jgi:hypothetical protein
MRIRSAHTTPNPLLGSGTTARAVIATLASRATLFSSVDFSWPTEGRPAPLSLSSERRRGAALYPRFRLGPPARRKQSHPAGCVRPAAALPRDGGAFTSELTR